MSPPPTTAIDAIVLAGGRGTRLAAVLPDRQKVAAMIAGRPFLSRLIDWLGAAGISRVVLAAGHRAADVEAVAAAHAAAAPSGCRPQVMVSVEPQPLGTGGAVRLAFERTASNPILVLNGDSLADIDLAAFRVFHDGHNAQVSLALVPAPEPGRFGAVEVDRDGTVVSFREKPGASAGPAMINAGIYLFERAVLATLPVQKPLSLEQDVFPALIGRRLYAMPCFGRFIDIGTPESLKEAVEFFGGR